MIATGPNHEQIFKKAYSTTLSYLHCIGAAISAKKCFTFSTETATREELRDHWWTHLGARIPTVTSFRDLGGHLNVGRVMSSSTLTSRIVNAIVLCLRLADMPWDRGAKIKMVLTTILPMALYGCEVAAPAEKALERLTRAIARAIGYHSTTTSNLLVLGLASPPHARTSQLHYAQEGPAFETHYCQTP